jgi:hypothetical protein
VNRIKCGGGLVQKFQGGGNVPRLIEILGCYYAGKNYAYDRNPDQEHHGDRGQAIAVHVVLGDG